MGVFRTLVNAGLTNQSEEDLGNISSTLFQRGNMRAYCNSNKCVSRRSTGKFGSWKKKVRYPEERCPDCSSYLAWRRKDLTK